MTKSITRNATYINELLKKNRKVKLKAGIYEINEPVMLQSQNILMGKKNLSVKFSASGKGFPIIKCDRVNNVQIKDLVVEHINMPNKRCCYSIYI